MTALVVRADAHRLPLPDASVDLVVTSPPYFALRSYTDGGEHYAGQVGAEASPQEFIQALLAVTRECVRVLKPSGSLWVNLGDKYQSTAPGTYNAPRDIVAAGGRESEGGKARGTFRPDMGVRPKSLSGLPWRYALGCIDELGLILRAEVIWSKPNGLPESVTDRVRRSHETWFHMVKEPRYFSAVDEIREPHSDVSIRRAMPHRANPGRRGQEVYGPAMNGQTLDLSQMNHPLGKLPGSVWEVPTQPLTVPAHLGVDHFAAFPMEWPRRIIQGWSPSGICVVCGEGRRPVTFTDLGVKERDTPQYDATGHARHGTGNSTLGSRGPSAVITGYVCACPTATAPTRPARVLDPFGGTGTTALVAASLGRVGVSVDLSHDYSRLARWRTTDPGERARALQVDKPPVEVDGQEDLFGASA